MIDIPQRQIRALHDENTVRVYQAYGDEIADAALANGTFTAPSFKLDRMTWIKPSFLWMMYRAGWGYKDEGQRRILAVDISRPGFEWALNRGYSTQLNLGWEKEGRVKLKSAPPVLVQWDPERDLQLQPKPYRTIQIGLRDEAVELYVTEWIRKITDITEFSHSIHSLVASNRLDKAKLLIPNERCYDSV